MPPVAWTDLLNKEVREVVVQEGAYVLHDILDALVFMLHTAQGRPCVSCKLFCFV